MHEASYADHAWQGRARIEENVAVATDTYRIRLRCPTLASRFVPGQFVMLRLCSGDDPLLGRPLAVYETVCDAEGKAWAVDVVYLVVGRMTRRLAELPAGGEVEAWGPLGNGFAAVDAEHLVMVAGGIGQTPFLSLGREALGGRGYGEPTRKAPRVPRVSLLYGARTATYLAGIDDFRDAGIHVHVSTDDGSAGHHGLVTELIEPVLGREKDGCRIVCCGPEPMLKAVRAVSQSLDVPCQVSLETPMACGIGVCFSCVAKVRDATGTWDYRRTCVEGPVFDAAEIEFD